MKQLTKSYYSKITLICVATICVITSILLAACNTLIRRQEHTEYLKNYDIAISNLSASLLARQNNMATSFAHLFSDSSDYDALCQLYLSTNAELPPDAKEAVLKILSNITGSDQYCRGVLLLTRTGRLYQYDIRYSTLLPLELRQTNFRFTPYQLQLLSDTQLDALSYDYEKPASHVYGLSGTVFMQKEQDVMNLGYLIPLYSIDEFSTLLTDARLHETAVFTIADQEHNIVFSSDGNYESAAASLFPDISEETAGSSVFNGPRLIRQSEETYYTASIYNNRYRFYTAYQAPEYLLGSSYIQTAVACFGLFVCLISILLYIIAFRLSDRKIKSIQQGMDLVGQNNLSYRMSVPRSNDEFTQIIISFNRMCDELQRNVEKAYLYEISQQKAELYAMQTSINPHFLYNALEQIRVQIMKGRQSDSSRMVLLLSKMYRNQTRRELYITIGEECSYVENLINLYMYRYGSFEYEICVESSLKKYGIPKNTLQPLIENYFVHGMKPDWDDNQLTVTVVRETDGNDCLCFTVEDNGVSITPKELAELEEKLNQPVLSRNEDNGFALSNVNCRLKLVFGEAAALHPSVGRDGCGFRITFRIPPVLPQELESDDPQSVPPK